MPARKRWLPALSAASAASGEERRGSAEPETDAALSFVLNVMRAQAGNSAAMSREKAREAVRVDGFMIEVCGD